jgi:hypothetical protein
LLIGKTDVEQTMTILARLLISIGLIASSVVSAQEKYLCEREFPVLERGKAEKFKFVKRKLTGLNCNNTFEGEHFRIVHATSDEAISFDHEDKELVTKAANVYYHLNYARNFWIKEIKSNYVSTLPQIIVRLDITNAFSSTRQFMHAEQEKNYNNAWTIPEGQTPRIAKDQRKWFKEIWFSPAKKIESRKEIKSEGNNPIHESLVLVKDPLVDRSKNALIYLGLGMLVAPQINNSYLLNRALKNLGLIAFLYGAIETTKHLDKWFIEKSHYIDTAMIPDIIYHEYAHIALSDTMKTVHSVPVIEGMADYFATRVANRKKMYDELKGYSKNRSKDPNNKQLYHPYLEGAWNATSDFTLSLLWSGKVAFDKANEQRIKKGQRPLVDYDDLVFTAHKDLNENSDIANDLNGALVKACKEKCSDIRPGVNTLNFVFEKKGFN